MRAAKGGTTGMLVLSASLLVGAGCSESMPAVRDAGAELAPDAGADAGPLDGGRRVKPRSVSVELSPMATRELIEGPAGELEYGPIEPLDGVEVCIAYRRDAFRSLEPFDQLEDPPCVRSEAGRVVRIEGAPVSSDLVITADYPGRLPVATTQQTDEHDLALPNWAAAVSSILLDPAATEPWLEPAGPLAPDHGQVALWAAMVGLDGVGVGEEQELPGGLLPTVAPGTGVEVVIEPAGGGPERTTTTLARPRFLSLPAGPTRLTFSHPRLVCRPVGVGQSSPIVGLPLGQDSIELLVLPGHTHAAVVDCWCTRGPGDGALIDLGACTFEPALPDAGSGPALPDAGSE